MEVTGIAKPSAKSCRKFRGNTYYHQQNLQLDAYSKELQGVAQLLQEQVAEQQLRARTLQELVEQQEAICATLRAARGPAAAAAAPQSSAGSYTHGLLLSAAPQLWQKVYGMTPKVRLLLYVSGYCFYVTRKDTTLMRCLFSGLFHCGLV
jgi:hypothetical protein